MIITIIQRELIVSFSYQ